MQRWAYIQSTSYFNPDFYIRLSPEKILLLDTLLDCLVKVIKLLHNMLEASINHFAAYHPHYKEKLEITLIEFAYNLFHFRLLLKPLSLTGISSNSIEKFTTYYLYYKKISGPSSDYVVKFVPCYLHYKKKPGIIEAAYNPFLQLLSKLISLLGVLSHCIIEVMTPLHDMFNANKH